MDWEGAPLKHLPYQMPLLPLALTARAATEPSSGLETLDGLKMIIDAKPLRKFLIETL